MTGSDQPDEISSETPNLAVFEELKEILRSCGVDEADFAQIPDAAKNFLAGQYLEVRHANETIEHLQRRIRHLEERLGDDQGEEAGRARRWSTRQYAIEADPASETRGNPVVDPDRRD